MLVVDLLHEFELGIWKTVLLQLVRILFAIDPLQVNEMDRRSVDLQDSTLFLILISWSFRFRKVPRFGRGVIRKFSANVSELKRMAARHYEDLLQVRMP